MLLDDEERLLVLEIRSLDHRTAKFAAIDLQQKKLLWHDLLFKEDWWIGMSAIKDGSILFYTYENDQNPVPTSYFLYSIDKGDIIWESSDFNFIAIVDEGILGYTDSEGSMQKLLLDGSTGRPHSVTNASAEGLHKSEDIEKKGNKTSSYPFHYPEQSDNFNTIEEYLKHSHAINPVKAIDYLEIRNLIVISYYLYNEVSQKDNKLLDNFILVLDTEGNKLLNIKIDENLQGIGLGIFFVVKNQLIFSRNKSEIISYQIDSYE